VEDFFNVTLRLKTRLLPIHTALKRLGFGIKISLDLLDATKDIYRGRISV